MADALRTWTRGRTAVVAAAWAWLAAATWLASDALPAGGPFAPCALLAAGLGIGTAWVALSLAGLGNLWTRRGTLVWLSVPVVPVVAVGGAYTAWPMAVRVRLSEAALREELVRPIDPFEHVSDLRPEPRRVGLFTIEGVIPLEDGAALFVTGRWCFAPSGIAHVPGTVPASLRGEPSALTHLYGPWYRVYAHD